jgi:hypothetical protein
MATSTIGVTDTPVVPAKISASREQKLLPAISRKMSGTVKYDIMDLRKSKSKARNKSPLLILRMPIPADGTVPPWTSAACSNENLNFTTLKIQQLPAKKQMPVTQWIKHSWNQIIKKS